MTRTGHDAGGQRRGAAALLLLAAGFAVFLAAVFYSLPSNVLADRGANSTVRALSVAWSPQGWGFFTKPPSDPGIRVVDGESLDSLMLTPQNRAENLLGLSRTQRAQGPELAKLAQGVDGAQWFECPAGHGLDECVVESRSAGRDPVDVTNHGPVLTACGDLVLVESIPVKWSYRHLYEETFVPGRILEMSVAC